METAQMDILSILWHSGVVVKLVLALLLFCSVLSWSIIFKKRKILKEVTGNNLLFMEAYHAASNLSELKNKTEKMPFSPYREMFINGHNELSKIKKTFSSSNATSGLYNHFQTFGLGVIERSLKKGINSTNAKLDQLLSILASIGSISPFIGLFGTVWGIINSFTGLAGGGATLDAVAPGIAEALVATAIGLAVAIPAVWFYNVFLNENNSINNEMESFGQEFLNMVERSLIGVK